MNCNTEVSIDVTLTVSSNTNLSSSSVKSSSKETRTGLVVSGVYLVTCVAFRENTAVMLLLFMSVMAKEVKDKKVLLALEAKLV